MKAAMLCCLTFLLAVALFRVENAIAFSASSTTLPSALACRLQKQISFVLKSTENDSSDDGEGTKKTLEDKMASWEASEEEIKASTLGGVTPRSDAFDVGLYIAFPFMILASLAFAFFPFIMDKIDVSSVGPPPTV